MSYPSGSVVNALFDALDRVATINANGGMVASYAYAGPGRVLERLNGNGTSARFHDGTFNDSAYYDGARRPTRLEHVNGSAVQTGFVHEYDRVGNRKFERRLHDGGKGDNYVYDSLYRLVTFERLVPAANVGVPGQGAQMVKKDWKLDGVQNWRELITNGATTTTAVDAVNQYTAFGAAAPDHDLNGNTTIIDGNASTPVVLRYDFLNRLREVSTGGVGGSKVEHDYDAEGRRVRTRATAVASMPAVSEFVFDGWEEIEEHVKAASGSPFALARRYVHGRSLDEPLRLENLAFYPGPGTFWFQQSTLGNVAAIADTSGAIVERYTFDAYGLPQFETPANVAKAVTESDFGNPYLFHARRFEPGIYPLYDFRARFLDPTHGRFVQRDPPGVWNDALNFGGAMVFVAGNPLGLTDPFGLDGSSGWLERVEDLGQKALEQAKAAKDAVVRDAKETLDSIRSAFAKTGDAISGGATRVGNGAIAAVAGGATGAATGTAAGAGVGSLAAGVGAVPGATIGAPSGLVSGALSAFITGFLMPPNSSIGELLSAGAGSGAFGGAVGGAVSAIGKALAATKAARQAAEAARKLAQQAKRAEAARRAKSIRSLQKRVADHQQKLDSYRANPEASDHLGLLDDCSPEVRARIIAGRIRHLEGEIRAFQDQINALSNGGP